MAELKKVEQESKKIEEFVQEFRRATRDSRYEKKLFIEEFKQDINRIIMQKLMKSEYSLKTLNSSMRE